MSVQLVPKLDLTFTNQLSYLTGLHRSGWPYVMSQLQKLQTKEGGVLCDTYVDRTFQWARNAPIPYSKPWIGFIHHTFNTDHSDYNNVNLLKNGVFLESLVKCKGLFVFSESLQARWAQELAARGFDVPVTALTHPTETVNERDQFTLERYRANQEKKVIAIGAWLRDSYAIYELNNGKSPVLTETENLYLCKAALQGPRMQGYFKPRDVFRIFTRPEWRNFDERPPVPGVSDGPIAMPTDDHATQRITSVNGELPDLSSIPDEIDTNTDSDPDDMCRGVMCRDIMCRDSSYALNKYVLGAVNHLKTMDDSVSILPTASDKEYDSLLKQNVVFVKLLDAGAVNTVLECIVRNTPIVINRLPSIEEVLGVDYPLFYDTLAEAKALLDLEHISAAYDYLKRLDKSKFTGAYFLSSLTESEVYRSL